MFTAKQLSPRDRSLITWSLIKPLLCDRNVRTSRRICGPNNAPSTTEETTRGQSYDWVPFLDGELKPLEPPSLQFRRRGWTFNRDVIITPGTPRNRSVSKFPTIICAELFPRGMSDAIALDVRGFLSMVKRYSLETSSNTLARVKISIVGR